MENKNSVSQDKFKKFGFTIKDNVIIGKDPVHNETKCIAELLLESFTKTPDFTGIINADTEEKVTFGEMKDRSIRCALWLQKQGVNKNDIVCLSTPNQIDDYVPYFATFYIGAISNPWHYKFTKENARYFFNLIQPKVIFACEKSIDMLAQVAEETQTPCKLVVFGSHSKFPSLKSIMSEQTQKEVEAFTPTVPEDVKNQVGLILLTSGTTGNQEAVMFSYAHLTSGPKMPECWVGLWYSPLLWTAGAHAVIMCAQHRSTRIIHQEFNVETTAEVIEKYKVLWVFMTPKMLTDMCKHKIFEKYEFSSLIIIFVGGNILNASIVEKIYEVLPGTILSSTYGMTELTNAVSRVTMDCKNSASVGHVTDGVTLKVISLKSGDILGPNQLGEICIKSENIMLGYYKNLTHTKKMIDNEGWMHTGDIGYYDDNGELVIKDRIKQMIVTENYQLFLSEIATILSEHPDVKEATVIPNPNNLENPSPMAFVVKNPDSMVTEKELQDMPANYNKYYRLSGGVIFVDELPFTDTGKISIKKLSEKAKSYATIVECIRV